MRVRNLILSLKIIWKCATGVNTSTTSTALMQDTGFDPTGWELALVTTSSSNTNSLAVDSNLVGFFHLCRAYFTFLLVDSMFNFFLETATNFLQACNCFGLGRVLAIAQNSVDFFDKKQKLCVLTR